MLLREMFSAIGAPTSEQEDVDWTNDLKFFIDNDDAVLKNYFFPAVNRHKEHRGNPNAYKIYIRPLESCKEAYCEKFEIESPEDKFPKDKLIELAKMIAAEQEKHMEKGDYDQ
jgi:hypothetical protein